MNDNHLPSRAVCRRYSVTPRTIDRWLAAGHFPKPALVVNARRYWRETDLVAWERQNVRLQAG